MSPSRVSARFARASAPLVGEGSWRRKKKSVMSRKPNGLTMKRKEKKKERSWLTLRAWPTYRRSTSRAAVPGPVRRHRDPDWEIAEGSWALPFFSNYGEGLRAHAQLVSRCYTRNKDDEKEKGAHTLYEQIDRKVTNRVTKRVSPTKAVSLTRTKSAKRCKKWRPTSK